MKLDALISPGLCLPAIKHGQFDDLSIQYAYTFVYNYLDIPTGAQPITRVK